MPIIFIFGFIIYSIGTAQDIFSPFAGDFFITSENQTIPIQPPVAERVEKKEEHVIISLTDRELLSNVMEVRSCVSRK